MINEETIQSDQGAAIPPHAENLGDRCSEDGPEGVHLVPNEDLLGDVEAPKPTTNEQRRDQPDGQAFPGCGVTHVFL